MNLIVPRLASYLWAAPCSALGMLFALLATPWGARWQAREGVVEVTLARRLDHCARPVRGLAFGAITFGHVVLARSEDELACLRIHERAHVAQYERWGPLFLLAYPLSSLVQALRGQRPYVDNHFEVLARAAERADRPSARPDGAPDDPGRAT